MEDLETNEYISNFDFSIRRILLTTKPNLLVGMYWHDGSDTFSESSNIELQLYFDRTERETAKLLREDRDTFDFDFQHRLKFGKRHDVVWGLGYRLNHDNIRNTFPISLTPDEPLYASL